MKTSTQILPGIKAVGWVDCRHLPKRVDLSAICGMQVVILTDIHPIQFFDEPTCECKTKKDGAGYRSFLIGSLEAPRPAVECEQRSGVPSGDAAGYSYEIKHVAIKSMVPCVI